MNRKGWTSEKIFYRLLNNKSERTYWDNVSALRKRPTEDVFNKCVELTNSRNAKARMIGVDVLAQLGTTPRPFYKESLDLFFKRLKVEKNIKVVRSLLFAIGHNKERLSKVQIDILGEFNDKNSDIKYALIHSLLGVDKAKAIDTLIKLSSDKTGHIRDWATFGLGSILERDNKKIRAALWNRVNDKHSDTKAEAISGLAKRKDPRVKDIIMRELLTEEYGTQLFEAITDYGDTEFLPLLKQQLKKALTEKDINAGWLDCLKICIAELNIIKRKGYVASVLYGLPLLLLLGYFG